MTEKRPKETKKASKGAKVQVKVGSMVPFFLAACIHLVQPAGRPGLLHLPQLRVRAARLLLQLLQVNVNGVQVRLGGGDGQVAAVPWQTHAPSGAGQVQLAVIDVGLLQLEVHHVRRLAHVHQQVPEDTAQNDAQQLPAESHSEVSNSPQTHANLHFDHNNRKVNLK